MPQLIRKIAEHHGWTAGVAKLESWGHPGLMIADSSYIALLCVSYWPSFGYTTLEMTLYKS